MTCASFSWEVTLPNRKSLTLGSRPKGVLHIESEARGSEDLRIPLAVAKTLIARRKAELLNPASRAELLYELGRAEETCSRSRVEGLVDKRDYSSKELREKLMTDGYAPKVVEEAVSRAVSCGLVNDTRFADVFIRTKIGAGWGQARIARELSLRGIEVEDVEGWPYDYFTDDSELERALAMARRKRLTGKNDYERIVRFLYGRGFSGHVANTVARTVVDESRDAANEYFE